MTTFIHRRTGVSELNDLIRSAPPEIVQLGDDHRRSLAARFRAVPSNGHRRIDSWNVERAGQPAHAFRWSPATARRTLGNAALRRMLRDPLCSVIDAINREIDDQLMRDVAGYAQRGSMASWFATLHQSELALVKADAANWTLQMHEIALSIEDQWSVCASDAFYDVARARTTLRGRRDLEVVLEDRCVLLRIRSGSPGKSSGPGLRSDLTIATLAHPQGIAPARMIGLWPESGVCLGVDGTMSDLRAGARDLVRTAVAQQRYHQSIAA